MGVMETDFIAALQWLVRLQKCEPKGKRSKTKSQMEEGPGNTWLASGFYIHTLCVK